MVPLRRRRRELRLRRPLDRRRRAGLRRRRRALDRRRLVLRRRRVLRLRRALDLRRRRGAFFRRRRRVVRRRAELLRRRVRRRRRGFATRFFARLRRRRVTGRLAATRRRLRLTGERRAELRRFFGFERRRLRLMIALPSDRAVWEGFLRRGFTPRRILPGVLFLRRSAAICRARAANAWRALSCAGVGALLRRIGCSFCADLSRRENACLSPRVSSRATFRRRLLPRPLKAARAEIARLTFALRRPAKAPRPLIAAMAVTPGFLAILRGSA